ncbi:MAG: hypothetical protein H8Z69_03200 [Nanohaloarchaea archaeon]|nr:hypothetical protein [Candidatus Nanohaloarchaea archaeon]
MEPIKIVTEDHYHHIIFNDPDKFDTIRTPKWADNASDSVIEGSEVRTGKMKGSDEWQTESVLVPKDKVDQDKAVNLAKQIVEKIES